ncbi:MAG: hypothetical protein KOO62_09350 [candidate division Zixibacteria bacterium]|nr:hypothetical protein [candidate division Zixibacteria bacterium]
MRSCKLMLLLGTVAIVAASLAFYGCSSDDTSTGTVGNLNDPEFLAVHEQVSEFVDSTLIWFSDGLGSVSTLATDTTVDPVHYGPTDPNAETDESYVTYTDDGWHVIYFEFHTDDYSSVIMDSIQFRKDNAYQQGVTDLEALLYKHNWVYNALDTTVTHSIYAGNADYQFDNMDQELCSVEGSSGWNVKSKYVSADSTVWREFDVDVTYASGQISKSSFGWTQGCPETGTFSADIEMIYQKDADAPDTTNWNMNVTFNSGMAAVVATCGETTWSYSSRECWPPAL